jgi:addiction module RelE/StbE family toxin
MTPTESIKIKFGRKFSKQYDRAPAKVRKSFDKRLHLFQENKFHPLLNNHALSGKYRGYRSINVTGDWRAIFRELEGGDVVYFDALGTHSQLYR